MIKNKLNRLTIGLLAGGLSLLVGASVALADDLTFSSDTTLTISSRSYTIQAGSTATSIAVGSATLTVVVPSSSTFTISSPNNDSLTNDGGLTTNCGAASSSATVTGAATVMFTPSATTCNSTGGGALVSSTPAPVVVSSGGGGGGGSSSPVTLSISPNVTMTTVDGGCSGGNKYNVSTGALCVNNSGAMSGVYNLGAVTLKNGSRGEAVKELQKLLNKVLNLGLAVDGKLGPKTIVVIKKWQKEHGLKADGLIGPKTKAMMKAEAEKN